MKFFTDIILFLFMGLCANFADAHPGGKNKNGCHVDRKTGETHGHPANSKCGNKVVSLLSLEDKLKNRPKAYANCDAVRAAGANPIRVGDPGYGKHLDRDGDGIGCECGDKGAKSLVETKEEEGCPGPSAKRNNKPKT